MKYECLVPYSILIHLEQTDTWSVPFEGRNNFGHLGPLPFHETVLSWCQFEAFRHLPRQMLGRPSK